MIGRREKTRKADIFKRQLCKCGDWRQHDNVVIDNDDEKKNRIYRKSYLHHHVQCVHVHVHVTFYETKDI